MSEATILLVESTSAITVHYKSKGCATYLFDTMILTPETLRGVT